MNENTMMATVTKSKASFLELTYSPISNQEAVWLQHDPKVEADLRQSDFYMIAGRAEAKFTNFCLDRNKRVISFNMTVGEVSDPVQIHLDELPGVAAAGVDSYAVEVGEKMVRIWNGPVRADGSQVLEWFTTEKLLWDRSRRKPRIGGLERFRELATYDLLYVGIARTGDTFDRLIANGHKARMEILANEPQRYPGARVTDEIFLFMFKVTPVVMQTFEPEHDFTESDFLGEVDYKPIVADAEKAFVSLLKPQYNVIRFSRYPKGRDSLYGSEYVRYTYAIGEDLAFNTAHGRLRGARDPNRGISNDADFIFVEGDRVSFLVSGVDFPGENGRGA
jgi:hypothetical protein